MMSDKNHEKYNPKWVSVGKEGNTTIREIYVIILHIPGLSVSEGRDRVGCLNVMSGKEW